MKSLPLAVAALFAASPTLLCQEMPDPRHKEHDALKALAGDWEFTMKMEAMPGVEGMEKAVESKGTEHAELICNGLWLKSVSDLTWDGKPCQGIWLAGYDPFAKKYRIHCVSSDDQECGMSDFDGTYDEKTKTWTWTGATPHGEMRSVFVMQDADTSVETCYLKQPDGKETQFMVMTRKRGRARAPVDASAKVPALSTEQQLLHKDVGVWDATMKMSEAGQEPTTAKGTEKVVATCHGRWLWSDFKGEIMDAPFEGHALVGYDPTKKQYVSLWIDSMSPVAAQTTGTWDAASKAFTFTGTSVDPTGAPMTIKEKLTWKGEDTRLLQMEFKCPERTSTMEITYQRKSKG